MTDEERTRCISNALLGLQSQMDALLALANASNIYGLHRDQFNAGRAAVVECLADLARERSEKAATQETHDAG